MCSAKKYLMKTHQIKPMAKRMSNLLKLNTNDTKCTNLLEPIYSS